MCMHLLRRRRARAVCICAKCQQSCKRKLWRSCIRLQVQGSRHCVCSVCRRRTGAELANQALSSRQDWWLAGQAWVDARPKSRSEQSDRCRRLCRCWHSTCQMPGSDVTPLLKMSSPEFQVNSRDLELKCIEQKRCQKSGALVLSLVPNLVPGLQQSRVRRVCPDGSA